MREVRRSMQGPAGVARLAAESGESKTKIVIDEENVTKRFGDRAILKDLTLRVQRGDRIGIVGERHRQDDPAQAPDRGTGAGRGHRPPRTEAGQDSTEETTTEL